jgi:hypothetical protein
MKFYELAIGAQFIFRGRRFEKIAMSMANDEKRFGSVFMGETEVVPDGVPLLLPPEEAAKWKPDDRHWTEYLSPAPRPREPGSNAPATGRRDD